jgi:hypothetical protein
MFNNKRTKRTFNDWKFNELSNWLELSKEESVDIS